MRIEAPGIVQCTAFAILHVSPDGTPLLQPFYGITLQMLHYKGCMSGNPSSGVLTASQHGPDVRRHVGVVAGEGVGAASGPSDLPLCPLSSSPGTGSGEFSMHQMHLCWF